MQLYFRLSPRTLCCLQKQAAGEDQGANIGWRRRRERWLGAPRRRKYGQEQSRPGLRRRGCRDETSAHVPATKITGHHVRSRPAGRCGCFLPYEVLLLLRVLRSRTKMPDPLLARKLADVFLCSQSIDLLAAGSPWPGFRLETQPRGEEVAMRRAPAENHVEYLGPVSATAEAFDELSAHALT